MTQLCCTLWIFGIPKLLPICQRIILDIQQGKLNKQMVPDDTLLNANNKVSKKKNLLKASIKKLLDISHSKTDHLIILVGKTETQISGNPKQYENYRTVWCKQTNSKNQEKTNVHSLLKMTCTLRKLTQENNQNQQFPAILTYWEEKNNKVFNPFKTYIDVTYAARIKAKLLCLYYIDFHRTWSTRPFRIPKTSHCTEALFRQATVKGMTESSRCFSQHKSLPNVAHEGRHIYVNIHMQKLQNRNIKLVTDNAAHSKLQS